MPNAAFGAATESSTALGDMPSESVIKDALELAASPRPPTIDASGFSDLTFFKVIATNPERRKIARSHHSSVHQWRLRIVVGKVTSAGGPPVFVVVSFDSDVVDLNLLAVAKVFPEVLGQSYRWRVQEQLTSFRTKPAIASSSVGDYALPLQIGGGGPNEHSALAIPRGEEVSEDERMALMALVLGPSDAEFRPFSTLDGVHIEAVFVSGPRFV